MIFPEYEDFPEEKLGVGESERSLQPGTANAVVTA